jgi:hypothetical protein
LFRNEQSELAKLLRVSQSADLLEVALRLRAIAHDDGCIDAAQVKLIGLEEIQAAAGPRWPRMRERVRSGSIDILSRHAAPDDVIVPAGDGFLVILADGAPGETQERCRKMREALLTFYLGEDSFKTLRPEVTARSLTIDGFADLMTTGAASEPPRSPLLVAKSAGGEIAQARVFSIRERRVAGHWFYPVRTRGARRLAYNPDFILDGRHQDQNYLDLDIAVCDQAFSYLSARDDDGTLAVGFSVHATTMHVRRRREAFLSALNHVPHELRRRTVITIAEIEKGTPLISIAEWCSSLRALTSRVSLEFHYSDHAITSIGGAGAYVAGFHLPIYSGAQKGPRASHTLEQIRFWSRAVHAQGMRLTVHGFCESAFFSQAAAAGIDIATSDTLWPFMLAEPPQAPALSA